MSEVVSFEDYSRSARPAAQGRPGRSRDVFFERHELDLILNLYAFKVAAGEWRDYAIGHDPECCCFAVFRRSSDAPLYRIVKTPKLARKQGAYSVISASGRVLKRGRSIDSALKVLKRAKLEIV
ncbi:MAG TPA: DUF2794 domain-containing protein [Candidatus Cybelea sp.]|nr:DUF2794 domain-containing protein [Candidatus Cybelea sp.]